MTGELRYCESEADVYGHAGRARLEVLVAVSEAAAARGFQHYPAPKINEGMVFPSPSKRPGPITMWVPATVRGPLAMIWVDAAGRVVVVESPVQPGDPRDFTHTGAFVLETSPDLVRAVDLRVGDAVYLARAER